MKCPYCGADVKEKTLCIRCGKEVETPFQKMEVEYKEFKVSEFLEIRPKNYQSAKKAAKQAIGDIEKQGGSDETAGANPAQDEKTVARILKANVVTKESGREISTERSALRERKKPFFVVIAIIVLLMAAIAGAFFLWRFLIPF